MRIRSECDRVRKQMEVGEHHLPEWAQGHLQRCLTCAKGWHREQQYRRVVHAARHAPVPVCQLRWEQVQAQLTARAIRQRTLRWRFALTGAFASLLALFILGSLWLIYSTENNSATHLPHPPREMAMNPPAASPKAPHRESSGSKQLSIPPANSKRAVELEPSTPVAPLPSSQTDKAPAPRKVESKIMAQVPPMELRFVPAMEDASFSESNRLSRARTELFWMGESETVVALLPLPDLRPETGGSADYLPVQYGGSEESHVYSF